MDVSILPRTKTLVKKYDNHIWEPSGAYFVCNTSGYIEQEVTIPAFFVVVSDEDKNTFSEQEENKNTKMITLCD